MAYWVNDEVLKFINLYKTWPVIWDPNHTHHNDRNKVCDAWVRISDEMGIDVADLKKKKDSLLASYRSYITKIRASIKAANGQAPAYEPCWIFFEPLHSFLGKVYANSSSTPNTKVGKNHVKPEEEPSRQHKLKPHYKLKRSSPSAVETNETSKRVKLPPQDPPVPHHRVRLPPSNLTPEGDDECELYGKLLVSKLKRLPEADRQEVMLAIDSFIIDYSRNMRSRGQAYQGVTSPPSSFSYSQNATRPVISTPEPFCVIQLPKLEQERNASAENSSDPLYEEALSNSDDN